MLYPLFLRIENPFGKLIDRANGSLRMDGRAVFAVAEGDRTMSTAELNEFAEVMDRVRGWSPGLRIALAKGILDSLQSAGTPAPARQSPTWGFSAEEVQALFQTDAPPPTEEPTRGWPVERALGLLRTDREPPDDEECRRIIEEERWKKYGP